MVGVMAVSTALSVEVWPFGPWELFSRTRKPLQVSYIAKYVSDGIERPIEFGSLPAPYRGAHAILGGFTQLGSDEKQAVCESWAAGLAESGDVADQVRVYRLERRLRLDGRPPTRNEELVHDCEAGASP